MKYSLAWVEFRRLMDEIETRSGYSALNQISQRVLEWIAHAEQTIPVIYIQTIIMKSGIASPATLFKSLAILEHEGFLSITVDAADERRRIVKTTSKAQKTFDRLSSEVLKAYKSIAS